MASGELVVNAAQFKAKCLDYLRRIESGKLTSVTVTRRNKPVAVVRAIAGKAQVKDAYGFMRDVMHISSDFDPFEQVVDEPRDPFLMKTPGENTAVHAVRC
jgi:prevent-host-death family protein